MPTCQVTPERERSLLVLRVRRARSKARGLARLEAIAVLDGLHPLPEPGGPRAEEGGVVWVSVPTACLDAAVARLPRLGYTVAAEVADGPKRSARLTRVYVEDAIAARDDDVDRREFVIDTGSGPRRVRGYRGDGRASSRRGLAVADARLLVNLAVPGGGGTLLDPFAGTGGLVMESESCGNTTTSVDVDRVVAPGLASLTGRHAVADARLLPFRSHAFDGVGSEAPFDSTLDDVVVDTLPELVRVVRPGGRIVLMCAPAQADRLVAAAEPASLDPFLDEAIDRKGLDVRVIGWRAGERSGP